MLQMTPEASKARHRPEDDWNRLSLIARTVEDLELVDMSLKPETVLWRLFHEDEVRVQPAETVAFRCDCDAGRITGAEILCAGGTRRLGRCGRSHPRALRILRRHA